jgi:hypothetical protein
MKLTLSVASGILIAWLVIQFVERAQIDAAIAQLTSALQTPHAPTRTLTPIITPTPPRLATASLRTMHIVPPPEPTTDTDREAAWQRAYKTPAECTPPKDWPAQVQCGNAYMRAKKIFDRNYSPPTTDLTTPTPPAPATPDPP